MHNTVLLMVPYPVCLATCSGVEWCRRADLVRKKKLLKSLLRNKKLAKQVDSHGLPDSLLVADN